MVEKVTAAIASMIGCAGSPSRPRKTKASSEKTTAASAVHSRLWDIMKMNSVTAPTTYQGAYFCQVATYFCIPSLPSTTGRNSSARIVTYRVMHHDTSYMAD